MYKSKGLFVFLLIVASICMLIGVGYLFSESWAVGLLLFVNGTVGLFLCTHTMGKITQHNKLIWEKKEEQILRRICEEEREKKSIREEELQKRIEELVAKRLLELNSMFSEENTGEDRAPKADGCEPSASERSGYIYCPSCQAEQRKGRKICFHCGTMLK